MNQFAEIPATLSRSCYLNLTNVTHPSFPSNTGAEAKANSVKLVRNPKSLSTYYEMIAILGSGAGGQ